MNTERIKELFMDEEFVKQIMEQEEPEQVQALFSDYDIDLTVEEIIQIREMIEKHLKGEINLEALSDDDLENVTGGSIVATLIIGYVALGALAVGAGALMGGSAVVATHILTRRRW